MILMQKLPWRRFIKYLITGGSALALDFAIYFLLTRLGGVPYLLSRTISLGTAMVWNFTLNRNWTFRAKSGRIIPQATKFLIVMISTSGLSLALMRIGVSNFGLNDLLVLFFVAVITTIINFFAHQIWSYRTQ